MEGYIKEIPMEQLLTQFTCTSADKFKRTISSKGWVKGHTTNSEAPKLGRIKAGKDAITQSRT